jgi:hypothetical protein
MISFGTRLLIVLLAIIVIIFSVNYQPAPIVSGLTPQRLFAVLGGISVTVLLFERATEIFISIWRQMPADELKRELSSLADNPTKAAEATAKAKGLATYQVETKGLYRWTWGKNVYFFYMRRFPNAGPTIIQ